MRKVRTLIAAMFMLLCTTVSAQGIYNIGEVTLNDGDAYTATEAAECEKVTYNRTFNNTNWQAWYVPFEIDYDQLKNDFDVAEIINIHQADNDDDGNMDETELEVIKIKSGTLSANYPYLIRKKAKGAYSFVVENTVLEAAANNAIDCSSVKIKYNFIGTSTGVSGNEMYNNGYYALSGGSLMKASGIGVSLKPFRWYMSVEARNGVRPAKTIKIRVAGETTDIENVVTNDNSESVYYDLSGRRVENPTRGIYIKNGKKVIIK